MGKIYRSKLFSLNSEDKNGVTIKTEIILLQQMIHEKLLPNEEYELAAIVRDRISKLKKTKQVMDNQNAEDFQWTDERVLTFTRMTTSEIYGAFKGIRRLKDKLEHFKKIYSQANIKEHGTDDQTQTDH